MEGFMQYELYVICAICHYCRNIKQIKLWAEIQLCSGSSPIPFKCMVWLPCYAWLCAFQSLLVNCCQSFFPSTVLLFYYHSHTMSLSFHDVNRTVLYIPQVLCANIAIWTRTKMLTATYLQFIMMLIQSKYMKICHWHGSPVYLLQKTEPPSVNDIVFN